MTRRYEVCFAGGATVYVEADGPREALGAAYQKASPVLTWPGAIKRRSINPTCWQVTVDITDVTLRGGAKENQT